MSTAPADLDLIERLARLYTAVVGDILDRRGHTNQVMHPRIKALWPEAKLAGRCLPVVCKQVFEPPTGSPYSGLLESVEAITPGDIYVATVPAGLIAAAWGELLSTAARGSGGRGAVIDGSARDCSQINDMDFPLFAANRCPADSRGRITVDRFNVPIQCGGVVVNPGDYIRGDWDGLVVLPPAVSESVVSEAEEKAAGETDVRAMLLAGESVSEVFRKTGIL